MSRSRANQHPHTSYPAQDAQREHPTIQCDFFFMEAGKEDAVVALLMVDVWSRYVSVVPLKPRNTQTVGNALVKFLGDVGRVERTEIAGDNEPVLVAGMKFCQRARQQLGLETILTFNRTYEKTRTSVAERFVQTVRGLQKTLVSHLEASIKAAIPAGHPMIHGQQCILRGFTVVSMFMPPCAPLHINPCLSTVQRKTGELWTNCLWFGPQGRQVQTCMDSWRMAGKRFNRHGLDFNRWTECGSYQSCQAHWRRMGCCIGPWCG